MKILIDINHPAHVHLFKNMARQLKSNGHTILFTTRDKDVAVDLLKSLDFEYIVFGKNYKSMIKKLFGIVKYDVKMLMVSLKFKPDIYVSMGSIYAAPVSYFLRKPHIAFDDTENMPEKHFLYKPFTDVYMNPSCFKKDFGKKQILYHGYHELAYLHPNYFTPDPSILKMLNLNENEKFVILRFVSWTASHDVGHQGISMKMKINIAIELSKKAKVFITSETELPKELEKFRINIPPHKMHDALYYSSLLFGESATMASECAVLGVPSIYLDNEGRGYTDEEENIYNLVFNFSESEDNQVAALQKALEILDMQNLKEEFTNRKKKLLNEKIDVTKFSVWFVENYPESFNIMKEDPNYQFKFA